MKKFINNCKNHCKHFIIYLISFIINYLLFILLMFIINSNNVVGMYLINFVVWVLSMLFIFYIDKKYVPDLVDENNSSELFKFILIRMLSLIIEVLILFVFINVLQYNYHLVKLFSLIILFVLNEFYVRHIKFK